MSDPLDLQRARERHAAAPLRNGALGHAELLREPRARPEMLYHCLGEHAPEFSRLDTESKTAEPACAVVYSAMSDTRGSRIRYLRKAQRLTQQQLADLLGVSKGLVSQWENDQIVDITHSNWMGLLRVLHTDAEFLEFGPDLPRQPPGEGAGRWRKQKV